MTDSNEQHASPDPIQVPPPDQLPAETPSSPPLPEAEVGDSGSGECGPAELKFPVVGIGASAGGLEAILELLRHLPAHTGMAFVFVQHLDPRHKSNLVEILSRETPMLVREAADGMALEPNTLSVMPAEQDLALLHGVLHLMSRADSPVRHLPIDSFFRCLAEDQAGCAIGVVLSGTGSDGAGGLQAIKAEGGIALVQDPTTAKYDGMPRAAIAQNTIDFVLPPRELAEALTRLSRHPRLQAPPIKGTMLREADSPGTMQKLCLLLRRATGVDFTYYKPATVERRIARRMVLHGVESLKHYLHYAQQHPEELQSLFEDLLINVTGFFRDPDVFEALKTTAFPRILQARPADAPIRIWVPACATGEEAYSIAMCLVEYLAEDVGRHRVQIFATDISKTSIEKARLGLYPENIIADVSEDRLRRFFTKVEGGGYQVSKFVREMCIFANQDIVRDPPFSHLDLISCRNLLIYLGASLQKKLIPLLHFSLDPHGYLLLGTSETIGEFAELFALVDKKSKLYARKSVAVRFPTESFTTQRQTVAETSEFPPPEAAPPPLDIERELNHLLLSKYTPSAVVINDKFEIVRSHGATGRYLELAPVPSLNILKMARYGLAVDVRMLLKTATKDHVAARKTDVHGQYQDKPITVNLEVQPLGGADSGHFAVVFQEVATAPAALDPSGRPPRGTAKKSFEENVNLRTELNATKDSLREIIEEHESTAHELRAANEEIQSANEELQSTNEELSTAKEELQSTNEELTTLNEELENRNVELRRVIGDFQNVLSSVNVPVLILGRDLCVRSFTPLAEKMFRLIAADVGRSVTSLRLGIPLLDLEEHVRSVMVTLDAYEQEIRFQDGRWYSFRIRPYRSTEDRIEGAVLSLMDIHDRKLHSEWNATAFAKKMVTAISEPVIVLDEALRVVSANASFCETFRIPADGIEGQLLYKLGNKHWDIPALRQLLEEVIPQNSQVSDFCVTDNFPQLGRKSVRLNACRMSQEGESPQLILVAIKEIRDE